MYPELVSNSVKAIYRNHDRNEMSLASVAYLVWLSEGRLPKLGDRRHQWFKRPQ